MTKHILDHRSNREGSLVQAGIRAARAQHPSSKTIIVQRRPRDRAEASRLQAYLRLSRERIR